ncbi:MAG: hypothetical protein AB1696_20250, partial [Planctomycetota bacterium]
MMTLVGLSVAIVLSVSTTAEAQSKKKGKEPELAISKRGNLIFGARCPNVVAGFSLRDSGSHGQTAQAKACGYRSFLPVRDLGNRPFEDDFSGKELEWSVLSGEWKIEKKALMTRFKSTSSEDCPRIFRPFVGTQNV